MSKSDKSLWRCIGLLALFSCATAENVSADLDRLCDISSKAEQRLGITSRQRAREVMYQFNDTGPSKKTISLINRLKDVPPERRYSEFKRVVADAGVKNFECPALSRMMNPPPDETPEEKPPPPSEIDPWW